MDKNQVMIRADLYYINTLSKILKSGSFDENPRPKYKDGSPAFSKFIVGAYEEYNIAAGEFPITTLRNTAIKTGIKEILWIYQKQSNSLKDAHDMGINWWDDWNIGDGTIGQRYGATIRKYDLMNKLLLSLENDPFSRRHIIDMYQYPDFEETTGLYPCAYKTTWSVRKNNGVYYLDMTLDQRSNDYVVSGYINKIQYVALMMMVASHLEYEVGVFRHFTQNVHIYDRHFLAVDEILSRTPLNKQPLLKLRNNKKFYDFTIDDFIIENINGIKKIESELELAI